MQDRRGFTLIELMVALALLGVVVAGIYTTFGSQEEAYILQDQMAEMNQNARSAINIISKDIRNSGLDPTWALTDVGAGAGLLTATADTIVMTQDLNRDGDLAGDDADEDGEFLGYHFNAGRIERCTGAAACGTWQPFVDRIGDLRFRYVYADGEDSDAAGLPDDTDGDMSNDFSEVREVEIQVQANRQSESLERFREMTLSSRVKVRNLSMR
jgi:type IV pilus assembly protein PilW